MRRPGLSLKLSVLLMLGVVVAMVVDFSLTSGTPMDRARVFVFVAIALGMALVAALVLDGLVVRPLVRLSAQARRMESQDYAEPFVPSGMDEARALGEALEHLRARVVAERAELQRLNTELERRVEERSAALATAQAALMQRERLVAVGRLAAGVAHEVNNPAGVILGRAGLLLEEATALPAEAVEDLRVIARQAERIREITGALLRLGRPSGRAPGPVDLAAVARATAELARREATAKNVTLELAVEASPVTGDAGALEQVAYNLVRNAIQASPTGGRVRVVTTPGELCVEDQGPGLSPEVAARLFEPFFTTKPVGEGTGLGLAVAFGIVRDHEGTLTAENLPGGGACFRVQIPARRPEEEGAAEPRGG